MRALIMVLFFALAAIGIILAVPSSEASGLAAAPILAPLATTTISGTIDYYPNNLGVEVPYLVYQDHGASTKVLSFTNASTCSTTYGTYPCVLIQDALSAYYGGMPVTALGTFDAENLVVVRLIPA